MKYNNVIYMNGREISAEAPVYFIADIAANHDGDIERAKDLIWLAKKSGADAVKFQHHKVEYYASRSGFEKLGAQIAHQSKWEKPVVEIFKECECDRSWTLELVETAKKAQIDFFTTPYDYDAVELLDSYIPAYKIGSGDVTWHAFIEKIAKKNKPLFLATGASEMGDVERAVEVVLRHNKDLVLMQCNTNYTGSRENFRYINLRVLRSFAEKYPQMILGLSDHSPQHAAVLGAIALGAKVIEKHFTDDNGRNGPDHPFSLNPIVWKEMVERSRELELALGDGVKRVERNEEDARIVQQRSLYFARDMKKGEKVTKECLRMVRPALKEGFKPYEVDSIVGKVLSAPKKSGDIILKKDLEC